MSLEEDWQQLEVHTKPPAGTNVTKRVLDRAAWSTKGNFAHVRIEKGDVLELWIPLSLLVEIRVLRPNARLEHAEPEPVLGMRRPSWPLL